MSGILTPGERPGQWQTAGDHERRIRILEAVENCCDDTGPTCSQATVEIAATKPLLGWWHLGEPSGVFADSSGQAQPADGTLTAVSTALTRDVAGCLSGAQDDGAVMFNASTGANSDYITTASGGDGARFNVTSTGMTIVAHLNPSVSATAFLGGVIGNMGFAASIQGWSLYVEWPARTAVFWRAQAGGGPQITLTGPALPAGECTTVIAVYDTVDGHFLYYDGVLVADDATTFGTSAFNNQDPYIGRAGAPGAHPAFATSFYGTADEILVWGDSLTADEVVELSSCATAEQTPAEDISFTPAAGLSATNVQDAIEENADNLTDHVADPTGAHAATAVSFAPAGGISATDVQAAIVEDAADLAAHIADPADAHDASAISVADAGGFYTGTDVEAVLAELAPVNAAQVWMPLTTVTGGVPELVWDADDSLIPTLVSL